MALKSDTVERIEAKNDLRKKVRTVRPKSPDDDPVKRAEAALAILSRHFDGWMGEEVEVMAHAAAAWSDTGFRDAGKRAKLYRSVHDLKGQAATLGFPLASRVAASLCLVLERVDDDGQAPAALVDSHVDAIRAIFRERAKEETDRIGMALTETLEAVTATWLGENGAAPVATDDPDDL